ncbi:histone-lysine N-methyltransferase, H3 lysine-79 specific-like, partial [Homarus americanus]
MSTSSFASYVIAKLSGNITLDKAIVSDMSGRPKRLSSKPKLTAVWRTKSIPYEGSDQSQSTFKEDGSLLRLLRTKSMPSLRRGGDPATRILKASSSSPPAPHSGLENNLSISPSNSSLPPVTTKSLNPRSSQDMSECSDSTSAYVTMTITNQSDHSQEDHNKLTRSASDGHLWAVRKKKLRDVRNEFPAGTLPSVKSLRNKFDGKSETDSQSADETASWGSPVAAQHITSDSDVMDSPAAKLSPSKPFINKETPIKPGSLGKSAETPTDKSSSKMLETPPKSIKKRLQQFEKSPQSLPDDLPNTTLSSETHTASGDTVWQDTSGTSPCPASKPIMIVEKRPERESRQKRKNDGKGFRPRAKSEPDPSSIRRLNSETIPVSVRKLKMQFEQQATIEAASIKAPTSPHRAYQKRKEKLTAGHTKVQTEVTGVSDQDNIDKRSEKPSTPPRELKPPRVEGRDTSPAPLTPEVIVDSQATPSVRKLRKQFEKASSTQSHTKSAGRDVPSKPRMTIKMELRSPFEDAFDPQETEDQKKERLNHTLTQEIHYGTSVRNILRQFETLSPEEHKTQVDRKFTFENKPPDEAKPAGEILSLSLGESSTRDSEAKLDISQDSEMDFDVDSCSSSSDVDKATLLPGIQESKTAWSSDDDDEDTTKTVIPKDIDTRETKKKIAEYWALRELEIEGNQREEQTKMEDKYVEEDEKEREKDRMENEEEEQKRRELHQAEIERKERENSEREQMKEKAEQERKEKERVEKELKKENTEKVRKDKEKAQQQKEKEREEQERKKREEAEKAIKEKEKAIRALIKKEKAELDRQEREKMENER